MVSQDAEETTTRRNRVMAAYGCGGVKTSDVTSDQSATFDGAF